MARAHWGLMAVLVVALDDRRHEAGRARLRRPRHDRANISVAKATASLVPFFALVGTVVGSIVWGVIADIYGRKASILLSAVMFVGTVDLRRDADRSPGTSACAS